MRKAIYPFSVFKCSLEEIKAARRRDCDPSLADDNLMKLFNDEILPWSMLFLKLANDSFRDKKYGSPREIIADIFGPKWKPEQNMQSVEIFLTGLQGFLVHTLVHGMDWHDSQYVLAALDDMHEKKMLESILYLVMLKGKKSEYYDDSQFLVFNGYLRQSALDYSISIHNIKKQQ